MMIIYFLLTKILQYLYNSPLEILFLLEFDINIKIYAF